MSAPALGIVSLLYVLTAVDYVHRGDYGMALAFVCYAVANVGFILAR